MMHVVILASAGFLLGHPARASASAGDQADMTRNDWQVCQDVRSDVRLPACGRLLAAPSLSPIDHARALANRSDAERTPDAKLRDIEEAIRLDPNNADYLRTRAAIHQELHDDTGAIADETALLALHPGDLPALRARAALLLHQDRYLDALADLDAIIAARPEDGAAYAQRGLARWRSLDVTARLAEFGKDDGLALLQREACRDVGTDCKEARLALTDLERAIGLLDGEGRAAARADRAQILADRGDFPKALADLDEAVRLMPAGAPLRAARGDVRLKAGDLAGARADLDEAVRLSADAGNLFKRADIRYRAGDLAGARADIDAAMTMPMLGVDWTVLDAARKLRLKIALPNEPGMGPELKDLKISGVWITHEQSGSEAIGIRLDADAARRFGIFTTMRLGSGTQMLVDGQVIAQPRIQAPIKGGSVMISGRFTHEEIMAIAKRLSAPGASMTVRALE